MAQTKKGREVRKYFIQIEKLAKITINIINKLKISEIENKTKIN